MDRNSIFRRLRGAVGNAVVWGGGWAGLGVAAFAALKLAGFLPATVSWADAILIAMRFGIIGGIVGAAFSGVIGVVYRGKLLRQISPVRFGIGGGLVAGVFVPVFLQAMNLISGDGLVPMGVVLDDGLWAAAFGAVAAGGMLALARCADAAVIGSRQDRPGRLESGEGVRWAEAWDAGRPDAHAGRSADG